MDLKHEKFIVMLIKES